MEELTEVTTVRFFPGDKKKRERFLRAFKGRWDNDSHFIRCAVIFYERSLAEEIVSK